MKQETVTEHGPDGSTTTLRFHVYDDVIEAMENLGSQRVLCLINNGLREEYRMRAMKQAKWLAERNPS